MLVNNQFVLLTDTRRLSEEKNVSGIQKTDLYCLRIFSK